MPFLGREQQRAANTPGTVDGEELQGCTDVDGDTSASPSLVLSAA